MSSSLRPDKVISPPVSTETSARATNSTSRSVAVTSSSAPLGTSSTFDNIGIVCRRSTTPITACNGFNNTSRVALNFMVSTC